MDVFDKTSDNGANTQPDIVENEDGSISVGSKKYENWMEVAKGKLHADTFIETLKVEKHSVEERLNKLDSQGTMLQNIEEKLKNLSISSLQSGVNDGDNLDGSDNKNDKGGIKQDDPRFKELEDQILTMRQEQLVKEKQEKLKEALIDTFGGKEQAKEAWDKYQKSPIYDEAIAKEFAIKDPVKLANQVKLIVGENVQAPKPGTPKAANIRSMPASSASLTGVSEEYAKLYRKMKHRPNMWTLEDQTRLVELYDTHGSAMFEGTEDKMLKLE